MSLGSLIKQNLSALALPAPEHGVPVNAIVLVNALKNAIPDTQAEQVATNLYEYISSETFADHIDKQVGDPTEGESEDQYVARAKARIEKLLMSEFEK